MKTNQHTTVKKSRWLFLKKMKGLVLTALFLLFSCISVWASHFRYGNVQWQNPEGNTVTFKIQQAWRWSYFGNPAIGSVVEIVAGDGDVPFEFGDGTVEYVQLTVTSINASEDWFFGEVTITHTYDAPGDYTASFYGCCRISELQNNNDGDFRVQTLVNVGNGAKSSVSTVSPIIDVVAGNPSASFTIPAIDPGGGTMVFRLANADEAAGAGKNYAQPAGIAVDPSTGVVTFPTGDKIVGNLYSTQILINNGSTEIAVDFIIRIVEKPQGTPPYFVYPPTPDDNSTLTVNVGQPLSFDVKAQDDDAGSTVTLTVIGMPVGAGTTPDLPETGQPVASTFNWTPALADAGTYILTFKATDNDGASVLTSVNIVVSAACDPNFSGSIAVSPSPAVKGQAANTIFLGYGPQSVTLTASATGGNGADTYDWGSAGSGASITVSPAATATYTVTITDAYKCSTTSSVTIYVVDVRCGKSGDKILVCHNGCQLCVPYCKVAPLLRHKGKLGSCATAGVIAATSSDQAEIETVKEVAIKQVKIYPNPAQSYIVLEMPQDNTNRNATIRIADVTGKAMMDLRSNNQDRQTIQVSKLSSGVHLLQIINASGKIVGTAKFIIAR